MLLTRKANRKNALAKVTTQSASDLAFIDLIQKLSVSELKCPFDLDWHKEPTWSVYTPQLPMELTPKRTIEMKEERSKEPSVTVYPMT